ncbi:cerebrin prohormone-like [Ruditapes philippinarum]|uniref:cerebrin prohormone-like n=1 Tax=Ruditapes philippinarum TaxID=129788 RepID=UPI00295BBAC2|nr:cerebrin prohormone-like [Ruditapes philippinarum]
MQLWVQTIVTVCLIASIIVSTCLGNSVPSTIGDDERQEIAALAARILKIIMNDSRTFYTNGKRNAGTIDSLYNLPDLLGVGRR